MKQVQNISVAELTEMAEKMYGALVKAVADIDKQIIVMDAEMHVDEEQYLLEQGSKQADLWGFNLYPSKFGTPDFIEFDSMINIRPSQQNLSRDISDESVKDAIRQLVEKVVAA